MKCLQSVLITFSISPKEISAHRPMAAATTELLNGATNRYLHAHQIGTYVQDNIRVNSNVTVNIGLRWDWDGPLVEKNGLLTNFYPKNYQYDATTDTVNNIGLVVAGNNKAFGTKGVSASTLTGRQWGFGPRIGAAWSPSFLKNFVVRAGFGLYYDRGEYFTQLSPSSGGGISGPFGVTTEQPFVVPFLANAASTFQVPFGTSPPPPPPSNLNGVISLVPNIAQLTNQTTPFCMANGQTFCGPLFFGGYDPSNKLPYTENWSLDLQWQPVNDLVLRVAYVGNHGLHEVLPIPFNHRTGYGNSDFDRPHVFTVSFQYALPKADNLHGLAAQAVNGWGLGGLVVAESGQPYSVVDFSGGAASLFYGGGQDQITNPIVPIGGVGSATTNPIFQGTTGGNPANPVLDKNAFALPLLPPCLTSVPPYLLASDASHFSSTHF